jgi:carbon monoxide dehydrogenase subunit G
MIETEQSVTIAAPIAAVWGYASDIGRWAALMPGLQDCELIDDDRSRWTLKVGVGALVRTVKVAVHVERWAGPAAVDFTYKLESDPVHGSGTYRARKLGSGQTEVALAVNVVGTGPMAPMWEAMGKPLLPKFAAGFAEQFKAEIEAAHGGPVAEARPSLLARLAAWLRRLFHSNPKEERA